MSGQTISILSGGYATHEAIDESGNPTVTTIIKGTGPLMARLSELTALIVTGASAVALIGGAILIEDASLAQRLIMTALPIPWFFVTKWAFYNAVSRKKPVVHTTTTTSFYKFLRKQNFDINLNGKWVIDGHKKAGLEQRKRESKRANPDYKEPRLYIKALHDPIYEDASVLSYEYEGRRFKLMVFDTLANAQKAQAHLTAICAVMQGHKGIAQGTLTSPDQYWDGDSAGGINDHERSVS